MLLSDDQATTIDHAEYGKEAESYSVVRATLDEWFAGEVEAQGASVVPGMRVDGLLEENGRIVGIKVGEDEMRAGIVVACDGVNSMLGRQAGLFDDVKASAVGVGVKETIELAPAVINQRFGVKDGEGAARVAIGCTEGISGGGFLYTNKDSISLGIVFNPEQAARHGRQIQEIFRKEIIIYIVSMW